MYAKPNIIGKKMLNSHLTVTGIHGKDSAGKTLYSTQCDCKGVFSTRVNQKAWHLLHGRPSSCGRCKGKYKLIGAKRGEVTVEDITGETYKGSPVYLMRCSCGEVLRWRSCQLSRSPFPTCGRTACKAKNPNGWVLQHGQAAFNRVRAKYQKRAIVRGLVYELADDDLWALMIDRCYYCGTLPYRKTKQTAHGQIIYNGVDRLRNECDYVLGNVVSCCTPCNQMKERMNVEDFLSVIRLIANNHALLRPASKQERNAYHKVPDDAGQSRRIPNVTHEWICPRRGIILDKVPQPARDVMAPTMGN